VIWKHKRRNKEKGTATDKQNHTFLARKTNKPHQTKNKIDRKAERRITTAGMIGMIECLYGIPVETIENI
jgi:hypothetical protein